MSIHLPVHLLDGSVPLRAQILGLAGQHDAAALEEDHVVEEALDLANHLRRHKHGRIRPEVGHEGVENLAPCQWVQPSERFVENVESCPACKHQRQARLFNHALGQRAYLLLRRQPHDLQQVLEALWLEVGVEIMEEVARLAHGHPPVQLVDIG